MGSIRLLLADPDFVFRNALADSLTQEGYLVTCAASIAEVRTQLSENWFHLVIINVNMGEPNAPNDSSGLEFLREQEFLVVPKFALADYPSVSMIRAVLRPGPTGIPLAVDFLGKDSDLPSIRDALRDAIEKHVRVNWALNIRQKNAASILQLAQLIFPALSNAQIAARADELESLVRGVFTKARYITFGRLLLHQPGYAVIELSVSADEVQTLLLTCCQTGGDPADQPVPKNVDRLEFQSSQSSVHFTIQVYRIYFSAPLKTFNEVYASSSTEEVLVSTGELIGKTLTAWHASQRSFVAPERYGQVARERLLLSPEKLETGIQSICEAALANGVAQVRSDQRDITFQSGDGQSFSFPVPTITIDQKSTEPPLPSIACGLTHGNITGSSVLYDAVNQCWLIGRDRVGVGPVVLDFAALEMVVRMEDMQGIDLARRFLFEQQLIENDPEDNAPRELVKPLHCVRFIRQAAKTDLTVYMTGLYYTALTRIAHFQPDLNDTPDELIVYTHVLLLAGMLCDRLVKKDRKPQQAQDRLWIDLQSMEVWVEGNRVELTPQDLEILVYLYKNAGQQCSRQQIVDSVTHNETNLTFTSAMEDPNDRPIIEESRLNSAMSRLRLKIEPDPENPKYLHTIRGYGYRLDI